MIEDRVRYCSGRFELVKKLGEGTYGEVYFVKDLIKDKYVALKRVKFHGEQSQGIPATTVREVAILKEISHKNIVKLEDVIFGRDDPQNDQPELFLVFEAMDHDLKSLIKQHQGRVNYELIRYLMYQIIQGVDHLHSNKVLHRDLKPENILISNDNSVVKLCDFGLSRTIHQPLRPYSQEVLTLWYRAPELCINNKNYSVGVDTWAIGCIFAELIRGEPLFVSQTASELMMKMVELLGNPAEEVLRMPEEMMVIMKMIPDKKRNDLKDMIIGIDPAGLSLMRSLLQLNPLQRITCKQALQHDFFKPLHTNVHD